MSSEAHWTHDFCLGCDNETHDGPYCSQACRLADMRNSGRLYQSSTASTATPSSPFSLPPAVDFSAYKKDKNESSTQWTQIPSKRSSITSISSSSSDNAPSNRSSLSRASSFNSSKDSQSFYGPQISKASRQELRRYENSFDTNRTRGYRQACF